VRIRVRVRVGVRVRVRIRVREGWVRVGVRVSRVRLGVVGLGLVIGAVVFNDPKGVVERWAPLCAPTCSLSLRAPVYSTRETPQIRHLFTFMTIHTSISHIQNHYRQFYYS
jgi:hypothetical protein